MLIWVALNENIKQAKILWTINKRKMFESQISAGTIDKLHYSEKLVQTFPDGPMAWKSMQKMCGTMLRTGEQNNSTVVQCRNSMR